MRQERTAVVALGGNAVLSKGEEATAARELANVAAAADAVASLSRDYCLIVTHGNGPQVGNILFRMEECSGKIPPMPLDVCVAQSQGELGYLIQQTLEDSFRRAGLPRTVCTVVTQVVVDATDPAFSNPTKPIGLFMPKSQAMRKVRDKRWQVVEDSGRGYRRVVPSPRPRRVVEKEVILALVRLGAVVIAVGGGGIPVVEQADGRLRGVEGVIDKDLAAGLLAREVGASLLVILTDVDQVYLDFNTPRQRGVPALDVAEAREHLEAGQFPPGSMGPKIQAAIDFLETGPGKVLITDHQHLREAMVRRRGTWITAGEPTRTRRSA